MQDLTVKYDTYTWIPERIVQDAIKNKWELSLSYFILLRRFYNNNTFYNFSYRKLSKQTHISASVLNRHIKRLKEKGMIVFRDGNMTLVGTDKLKKKETEKCVAIETDSNKKSIKLNIQFTRILRSLRQQQHVVIKKVETIQLQKPKFISKNKAKRLLKYRKEALNNKQITEKSVNDYYMLSNQKIGQLNNRSKSTGIAIQKKLNEANLIKSTKNRKLYSEKVFDKRAFYNLCLPSCYQLSKRGLIYRVLPNKIEICNK